MNEIAKDKYVPTNDKEKIKYILDHVEQFANVHNLELYVRYGELKEVFKIVVDDPTNIKKATMFVIDVREIENDKIDWILDVHIYCEISKDFGFEY